MKPKALTVLLLGALCAGSASAQTGAKPKLVVNIVISQMRADYMDRFQDNFSADGFRRFMDQGAYFTDAHYNYMQTNTAAGLATLSTGTNPDGHGIVAEDWIDFTTNNPVNLIADPSVTGLDCDAGVGCYSPLNLTAATLGDRLKESDAKSKVVSIAATPVSAIVSGGHTADVFWMDAGRGHWISSTYYFKQLPTWVTAYNKQNLFAPFMERSWEPSKTLEGYKNSEHSVIDFTPAKTGFFSKPFFRKVSSIFKKDDDKFDAAALLYTPFGNSLTTQFAREAIVGEELGKDDHTDLLTIVYDTPRLIGEHFGPRSIELEDMYYKLDTELGILTDYLLAQFKPGEVVVVLTSDHGTLQRRTVQNDHERIPERPIRAWQLGDRLPRPPTLPEPFDHLFVRFQPSRSADPRRHFRAAVPWRERSPELHEHAERLFRRRFRRKNTEQFLPETFGRYRNQPDAGLDRGRHCESFPQRFVVRLRYACTADVLRRKHSRTTDRP